MAVVAVVHATGHVDPPGGAVVLENQLVEVHRVAQPAKEQTGYLFGIGVAERPAAAGDGDVGGFALHVLGGIGTANEAVELWTAVARRHLYGQAEVLAQGFETALAEVLQRRDVALQGRVGDVMRLGRLRAQHLRECEVLREEHLWIEWWFHFCVG